MGTTKNGEEVLDRVNGEIVEKRLEKVSTTTRTDGGVLVGDFERNIVTLTKGPAGQDHK